MTTTPPYRMHAGSVTVEDQVDHLIIKVDRLTMVNKILKWAVGTAVVFALGSIGAVASWVYSRGVEDQTMRNGIERAQRDTDSLKEDVKEIQKIVFTRRNFVIPQEDK